MTREEALKAMAASPLIDTVLGDVDQSNVQADNVKTNKVWSIRGDRTLVAAAPTAQFLTTFSINRILQLNFLAVKAYAIANGTLLMVPCNVVVQFQTGGPYFSEPASGPNMAYGANTDNFLNTEMDLIGDQSSSEFKLDFQIPVLGPATSYGFTFNVYSKGANFAIGDRVLLAAQLNYR